MGEKTGISWTRGDDGSKGSTWNAIRGCTPVSPGCKNCYAAKVAQRFSFPGGPFQGLVRINAAGERTDEWNGEITFVEDHLEDPIRWKRPRRIFVNSVSDLFHHNVSDTVIDRIFAVMALAPQHTFQVLTKRPETMRDYMLSRSRSSKHWEEAARSIGYTFKFDGLDGEEYSTCRFPLPNVWLGTSVENQKYADERIPFLLETPAAVRFISAEPLLGDIRLDSIMHHGKHYVGLWNALTGFRGHMGGGSDGNPKLDWVIVGGESQRGSRPMHPDWARSLRDQCKSAGVAFFFKQWGDWIPVDPTPKLRSRATMPGQTFNVFAWPDGTKDGWRSGAMSQRLGTKKTGDYLDGVQHHEYPEARA